MVGQTISHYKIIAKLGEGGMGEVFLAHDTLLDRKVALKFLPDFMQEDPVAQKRFLREAKSAAALDHPYICHIHEVGEEKGKPFISMEYVQGETLKDKLTDGPLAMKDALQKAVEIAEALEGTWLMDRDKGGGSSLRMLLAVSSGADFWKGCVPVSISYRTTPKEKMSDRVSTSFPRNCSGDM